MSTKDYSRLLDNPYRTLSAAISAVHADPLEGGTVQFNTLCIIRNKDRDDSMVNAYISVLIMRQRFELYDSSSAKQSIRFYVHVF